MKEVVQLYIDNELDARATLEAQQHLESCASCSRLLAVFLEHDRVLKEAAGAEKVDTDRLRANILSQIQTAKPRTSLSLVPGGWRNISMFARVAAVIAAAIALAAAMLILMPRQGERVFASALADHEDHCSFANTTMAKVEPDELAQLDLKYFGLSMTPDLSQFGYGSARGRECRLNGKWYLHLVYYKNEEEPVSLFLSLGGSGLREGQLKSEGKPGYQMVRLLQSGVDLIVVSPLAAGPTASIAKAVAAEISAAKLKGGSIGGPKARRAEPSLTDCDGLSVLVDSGGLLRIQNTL
ncbi:MAG TPA: zf-HC2 domain-containing protein [Blastocatellia bacterium]|nr:zf-HC2 domain-containing protein [Blastocatellia bacterium]